MLKLEKGLKFFHIPVETLFFPPEKLKKLYYRFLWHVFPGTENIKKVCIIIFVLDTQIYHPNIYLVYSDMWRVSRDGFKQPSDKKLLLVCCVMTCISNSNTAMKSIFYEFIEEFHLGLVAALGFHLPSNFVKNLDKV